MRIFRPLYDWVIKWCGHPRAESFLAGLSFAESSFFPIPPDVMLAPMTLARPSRSWRLATITTVASVLGGVAGYAIGWFSVDLIEPLLRSAGYWEGYVRATEWFELWGFLAVLAAGFSPIPYKVFTIAAGALQMFLPLFIVASLVGRGARFFLVAALVKWGGPPVEQRLKQHIDLLGWITVAAAVVVYVLYRIQ